MIALAALALMQGSGRVVSLVGGTGSQAEALLSYLGEGYTVVHTDEKTERNSDVLSVTSYRTRSEPKATGPRVAVVLPDEKLVSHDIDRYVPKLRSQLLIEKRFGTVFVCIPKIRPDAGRTSSYVAPLTRQAAREAGVATIDLSSAPTFAEAVGEAIIDQRLEKKGWRLVSFDSQQIDEGPAANAIDGSIDTYWHTQYDPTTPKHPHQIVVDMGKPQTFAGFRYTPRQDGGVNGRVKGYELYTSSDGQTWGTPISKGDLPNTSKPTRIRLDGPAVTARYFRFVATSEQNNGPWTTIAEIDILRSHP